MKAIILNDYGPGEDYATYVSMGIKTIETRMGRLYKHRGNIIICKGKTNSVGINKGLALCIVNIFDGRYMIPSDEEAACISYDPKRGCLLLKDWIYFSEMFEFTNHSTTKNYQGIFDIEIPKHIKLIPQPQITGFVQEYKT